MKKSGFTVWELLAVIIIILAVAAILFPVFQKARESGPTRSCPSNMKQLGLAILQYVQENDESMPNIAAVKNRNETWRALIYPYDKSTSLYRCPDSDEKPTGPDQKFDTPDGFAQSYAANYTGTYSGRSNDQGNGAFGGIGAKPITIASIDHPGSLIQLCEVWHHSTPDFNIDNLGAFHPGTDMLWAGHTDGGDYLCVDGHVKYYKPLDTRTLWHRDASIPLSTGSVKVLQNAYKGSRKRY